MRQTYTPQPQPIEPASTPEPVPPEDRIVEGSSEEFVLGIPRAVRKGRRLLLENEPVIPTRICIKSGRPAYRETEVSLRNPKNPMTWFGKRPTLHVGLSRREFDNYRVAIALTWSFLGIGCLMLLAGLFSTSWLTCLVGLLAMGFAGVFRACSPVTSPDATDESATILGAGPTYLQQFEEAAEVG